MATISGTITGVSGLRSKASTGRKAYLLTVDFGAYTGASDTAAISGVGAAILAHTRNGKTVTLRGAVPIAPGKDTAAQDVYFTGASVQAATVSTDDLTGNLSNAAGTELTSSTACKGVEICVIVDEA
jgi:hypothetical protein